ncbi:MAG: hypothetical protein WCP97_03935 [bacterium]
MRVTTETTKSSPHPLRLVMTERSSRRRSISQSSPIPSGAIRAEFAADAARYFSHLTFEMAQESIQRFTAAMYKITPELRTSVFAIHDIGQACFGLAAEATLGKLFLRNSDSPMYPALTTEVFKDFQEVLAEQGFLLILKTEENAEGSIEPILINLPIVSAIAKQYDAVFPKEAVHAPGYWMQNQFEHKTPHDHRTEFYHHILAGVPYYSARMYTTVLKPLWEKHQDFAFLCEDFLNSDKSTAEEISNEKAALSLSPFEKKVLGQWLEYIEDNRDLGLPVFSAMDAKIVRKKQEWSWKLQEHNKDLLWVLQ